MTRPNHRPWTVVAERNLLSRPPFLSVSAQTVELPNGRTIDDYYQLSMPDFAGIYAETEQGQLLLMRSYRHGPRKICLNFPGGGIAEGETPATAARRELLEETGYQSAHWQPLGSFITNINQRCQTAYLFRATGCEPVAAAASGDLEDSELVLASRQEALAAMQAGEFSGLSHVALLLLATHPDLIWPSASIA